MVSRVVPTSLLCVIVLALAACGSSSSNKRSSDSGSTSTAAAAAPQASATRPGRPKPKIVAPAGPAARTLVVKDLIKGTGAPARPGELLTVDYIGALYKTGKVFDNSYDKRMPFQFPLGSGMVIQGWERGLPGMRIGGRRELLIPPELGYGAQGSPPNIPPNAPLIFIIDLRDAQ